MQHKFTPETAAGAARIGGHRKAHPEDAIFEKLGQPLSHYGMPTLGATGAEDLDFEDDDLGDLLGPPPTSIS